MDNRSIVMLNRAQLQPHPDNPRKDLGDLTELRESIRENGIMQNLTVVPCGDGLIDSGDYMILIHGSDSRGYCYACAEYRK